jgi:hypothetical protein
VLKNYVKMLLAGLAVGGAVGFASLFWDDREYLLAKAAGATKVGRTKTPFELLEQMVIVNKLPFGVGKITDASGKVTPLLKVPRLPTVMEMPSGEIRELSVATMRVLSQMVAKKYREAYGYDLVVRSYED